MSGDDDVDWDNVHPALDTSKFSHLTEEEMQAAVPETELPFGETVAIEGILSFSFMAFLVKHIDVI